MIEDFHTRTMRHSDKLYSQLNYSIPKKCPLCDIVNMPSIHGTTFHKMNDDQLILFFQWKCSHCFKFFITGHLRSEDLSNKDSQFLFIYPHLKDIELPQNIKKVSPRFIEIYNEAYQSESIGNLTSAGMTYRLALEILIKDYAIKELNFSQDEVISKSLFQAIEAYLPNFDVNNVANVIRLKGNDYSHYIEKYKDVEFETFKDYLGIFIQLIDTNLKINHPPVKKKS